MRDWNERKIKQYERMKKKTKKYIPLENQQHVQTKGNKTFKK